MNIYNDKLNYNNSISLDNKNYSSNNIFSVSKIFYLIIFIVFLIIVLVFNYTNRVFLSNKDKIAVTGDSYGSYLYNSLNNKMESNIESYFVAGKTIIENEKMMLKAMDSNCKYVFIAIGVNDHFKNTNLQLFHNTYEKIIKEGLKNNKIIFTHSFVEYPVSKNFISKYSTRDYDNIIRSISNMYDNVYYININEYGKDEYFEDDNLHLNKKFYDKLYGIIINIFDKKNINLR